MGTKPRPRQRRISSANLQAALRTHDRAASGTDGLRMAEQNNFDLILKNMTKPDLDGLEVTRQIRSSVRYRLTLILAFKGLAFESDRQPCLDAGMNDVVSKPVKPEPLFAKLWDELIRKAA